jgi:hypothetical protein
VIESGQMRLDLLRPQFEATMAEFMRRKAELMGGVA